MSLYLDRFLDKFLRIVAEDLDRAWPLSFRNTCNENSALIATENLGVGYVLGVARLFFTNTAVVLNFANTSVTASRIDERAGR